MFDHRQIHAEARRLVRTAQAPVIPITALMMGICLLANQALHFILLYVENQMVTLFFQILVQLVCTVLQNGFLLYCMAIRQEQLTDYPILFDAFAFAGKIIALSLIRYALVGMGATLFFFPGVILFYCSRFALYNLCENPNLGVMEALQLSFRQTQGHKKDLLAMDLSFAGWALLSDLPYTLYLTYTMSGQVLPISDGWVTFICNFTTFFLSLFWMARHRLCMLACLERCKASSGMNNNALPPQM